MRISDWSSDVCSSDLIEDALGDDVEHDLTRPAFDRIGLGAQPAARAGTALGLFAVPFERVAAAARHHEFVAALVQLGPDIFHHFRTRRSEARRVGKEWLSTL